MTAQRLPWGPLEEVAGQWVRTRGHTVAPNGSDRTTAAIADILGTTTTQINHWRTAGQITVKVADQLAVGLRMHPAMIWPDWWQLPNTDPRSVKEKDRDRQRERTEFRRVMKTIDREPMRQLRAAALAESWALRGEQLAAAS